MQIKTWRRWWGGQKVSIYLTGAARRQWEIAYLFSAFQTVTRMQTRTRTEMYTHNASHKIPARHMQNGEDGRIQPAFRTLAQSALNTQVALYENLPISYYCTTIILSPSLFNLFTHRHLVKKKSLNYCFWYQLVWGHATKINLSILS